MKKVMTILVFFLLIMAGFGLEGCKRSSVKSSDSLITVDVTKSYPKKELILQDFMDVEYIPLETNDNFLTQGSVLAIGKDIIAVRNRINDGDIFIFDRATGKGLRKINRRGQGPEEYVGCPWIVLDEQICEIFVNDILTKRILVYDFNGKFKRSFRHKEDALYVNIHNFDRDNLICYDGFFDNNNKGSMHPFFLISKQNGIIISALCLLDKK